MARKEKKSHRWTKSERVGEVTLFLTPRSPYWHMYWEITVPASDGHPDSQLAHGCGEIAGSNGNDLLTPEEAARCLKVTAEHVRALIRSGRLSAVNIGTGPKRPLYRIPLCALGEFLSSRHQSARATRPRCFKRLPPVEDHFPHLR